MKILTTLVAVMALALATAGTAQAAIQLSKILPYPGVVAGDQNALVNAEYIVVRNRVAGKERARLVYPKPTTGAPPPPTPGKIFGC
jgi:hypothetical protein